VKVGWNIFKKYSQFQHLKKRRGWELGGVSFSDFKCLGEKVGGIFFKVYRNL